MQLMPSTQSRAEQIVMLGRLSMISEREGEIHTLILTGELDLANAPKLEDELRRIEDTDAAVIIVDLAELAFVDSTGIRVFLTAAARSRSTGRLVLQDARPGIMRVFHLAGVVPLLPLCG